MPAYQLQELLTRIGLAFGAGVIIAIVPIAYRKARWAPHLPTRITFYAISLLALIAFFIYGAYLWNRFVPREPPAPAPITFPVPPTTP